MANFGSFARAYIVDTIKGKQVKRIAFRAWVVWVRTYEVEVSGQKNEKKYDIHLTYSGDDGWLRYADRWKSNKLCYGKPIKGEKHFYFDGQKGTLNWNEIVKRSRGGALSWKNKIRLTLRETHSFFIWSSGSVNINRPVFISELRHHDAVRNISFKTFPPNLTSPVKLRPWDYQHYFQRLVKLTKVLDHRIAVRARRLGAIGACATLIDQADSLIKQQNKERFFYLKTLHLRVARIFNRSLTPEQFKFLAYAEKNLLQTELIEPLKEEIKRSAQHENRVFEQRFNPIAKRLEELLQSEEHAKFYDYYFYGPGSNTSLLSHRKNIDSFMWWYKTAYVLLLRGERKGKIYNDQVAKFLNAFKNKNKSEIKKVIDQAKKGYGWVKDMKGSLLEIVQAKATHKMGKTLTIFRNDLVGAMRFLEKENIAFDVDKLEKALNTSVISGKNVQVQNFIKTSAPSNIKSCLGICLSTYAFIINSKDLGQKKKLEDEIETGGKIIGAVKDVTEKAVEKGWFPGNIDKLKNVGGIVTSTFDWGLTIYKLDKAAMTGDPEKFTYAVVSYAGKAFMLGGTILSFMFPPAALLLTAGKMIETIADIYKAACDYTPPEYIAFKQVLEKTADVERRAKFEVISGRLKVCLQQKVMNSKGEARCKYAKDYLSNIIGSMNHVEENSARNIWGGHNVQYVLDQYFEKGKWSPKNKKWGILTEIAD